MTAPQFIHPEPRFQGAASLTALDKVLEKSTGGQKLLGKALQLKEGDNGLSYLTFLQDTLVALIPRALVSRSKAELTESTFLELMESAVLYYGLPIVGNRVFRPLFNRAAGVHHLNDGKPLTPEFEKTLEKAVRTRVIGAKAATILSTFGVTLVGGEYVIHYIKNLLTAKMFNKDSFSDVVNLSQGQMPCSHGSPVVHKAQNRIKQCLAICGGILAGSLLLARGAEKWTVLENGANALVKHLNFIETKSGGLSLSRRQMELYMGLSVLAYLDSARDHLERVETASRLLIVLPYLARGQGLLQKLMLKGGSKYFTPILKNGIFQKNEQAKALEVLAQEALDKHPNDLSAAARELTQPLRQKGILTGVPLAFGVLGTGVGVGVLNRFWTQYRYQKQQQEKQQVAGVSGPLNVSPSGAVASANSMGYSAPNAILNTLSASPNPSPALEYAAPTHFSTPTPIASAQRALPASGSAAPASPHPSPYATPLFSSTLPAPWAYAISGAKRI